MKKIIILIFLLLFLGINAYSKSDVSQRDLNMISLAFTNGAVELAKLDIKQIQKLKKDKDLLRATVYTLAKDYIKQVQRLNSVEKVEKNNPGNNYWNH